MYLTEKQLQVLEYVRESRERRGISPTLEEMATHFGVSKMTIHEHVKALEQKGAVSRAKHRARSIEIKEDPAPATPRGLRLPLKGLIAAGSPVEAIEHGEEVDVSALMSARGEVYMLRVKGDSMIEDGILEGDFVIVEKKSEAMSGQTVVATLPDGDATLKRLYKEKRGYRLQPANAAMAPILVDDLAIDGVVIGILRSLRRV